MNSQLLSFWSSTFSQFSDVLSTKWWIDWMLTGPFKHMKLLTSPWSAINRQMSSLEYLRTGHLPSKSTWEDGCCVEKEDAVYRLTEVEGSQLKTAAASLPRRSITLNADTFLEKILYWFYIRIHLSALEHTAAHISNKDPSTIFIAAWFMARRWAGTVS